MGLSGHKKNKLFLFKIIKAVDYESDAANAHKDLPYYPAPVFNSVRGYFGIRKCGKLDLFTPLLLQFPLKFAHMVVNPNENAPKTFLITLNFLFF